MHAKSEVNVAIKYVKHYKYTKLKKLNFMMNNILPVPCETLIEMIRIQTTLNTTMK